MDGVILILPHTARVSQLVNRIGGCSWKVDVRSEDEVVLAHGKQHAYILRDDGLAEQYDKEEATQVLRLVPNPIYFGLEFNDFEFGKAILSKICDADYIVVDSDHGEILTGHDFVARLRAKPDWDWRV